MDLAAVIIATMALVISSFVAIWMGAKHFSTHKIQMVPIDPFKDSIPSQVGNPFEDPFKELGDPIDSDERERLELLRQKKGIMT